MPVMIVISKFISRSKWSYPQNTVSS